METASLVVHVAAGLLAILAGYVAIFAAKGATLHRRSGLVFEYAMMVMGLAATVVATLRDLPGSRTGGLLAAYFTITAFTAVRPIDRRIAMLLLVVPLSAATMGALGIADALARGRMSVSGVPIPMILLFTVISVLAATSDVRLMRAPAVGTRRIARHLWRMCFAFWIATGSFFLGQMDEFPVALRKPALLAIPALLPLVLMFYWLWRVKGKRALAGLLLRRTSGAAPLERAA